MKKIIRAALVLSLLLAMLLPSRVMAASASCVVTSADTARAGGTVNVTVSMQGGNLYGFEGTLSYSSNLELKSVTQNIGGKWSVDYSSSTTGGTVDIQGQDLNMTTPITSNTTVFTVTFNVSSKAVAGDEVSVTFGNIEGADGTKVSVSVTGDTWKRSIADKPSSVCHLTAIRCGNATLSPSFNKDTLYYTANVPYSVSKLSLDYDRADKTSTVSISSTELAVGANTITMKCTAADGTSKTYTISVTRQQDPNYKPGTDATLKELKLDVGTLSPAFNAKRTEYVAYVPYETKEATLSGVANDDKAVTSGEKTVKLTREGANDVAVICTAEDGKTVQTYTVHVFRMPVYVDTLPTVEVIKEPVEEEVVEETPTLEIPALLTLPLVGEVSTLLVGGIASFIVVALLVLMGVLIGRGTSDGGDEPRDYYPQETRQEKPSEKPSVQAPAEKEKPVAAPVKPAVEKPQAPAQSAASDEERAADEAAKHMSLDELLNDIRDM